MVENEREKVTIGQGDVGVLDASFLEKGPDTGKEGIEAMVSRVSEIMEITVVVYEKRLHEMLDRLTEEKAKGNHSVMIEQGAVTFHVCADVVEEGK